MIRLFTLDVHMRKGPLLAAQELHMNQTLEDNGVVNETSTFEDLQVPSDAFIPVLHVYWNDDLTVA